MVERMPSIAIESIDMDKCYFNPGCAMSLYKPELPDMMLGLLRERFGSVKMHRVCCHHDPGLPAGSVIINNCAGCDRRFRKLYAGISTITYWELLDSLPGLELPDYGGLTVSVHDSCSFRCKPQVHAVPEDARRPDALPRRGRHLHKLHPLHDRRRQAAALPARPHLRPRDAAHARHAEGISRLPGRIHSRPLKRPCKPAAARTPPLHSWPGGCTIWVSTCRKG